MRVRSISLLTLIALLAGTPVAAQDRTSTTSPTRTTTTTSSSTTTAEEAARKMFLSGMRGAMAAPQLQADFRLSARDVPAAMRAGGYGTPAIVSGLVTGLRTPAADAAKWMREDRQPAGETALGLREAGLADARVATALKGGGFAVAAAADALLGGLKVTEATVGKVLADGGYAVLETREALVKAGIESDPEFQEPAACMTWDGQLMCPGGSSGSSTWGQAMGAVTVSPSGAGEAGATLTMESTNIPEVEVRIGNATLQLLEATASRIRAVLPSSPMTGDLVMVRQTDGVVGTIVASYQVVQAAPDEPPAAWDDWSDVARDEAVAQVRLWLATAKIVESGCTVIGPNAHGGPGVFASDHDIASGIRSALQDAGAPNDVAQGWGGGFADAWHGWADKVTIPALPLYPAFAAWPQSYAPPMASVLTPLATLVSGGLPEMSPAAIADRIEDAISGDAGSGAASAAITEFANDLGTRFAVYLASAQIMNVMGQGPVPGYAPPSVPVGPVVNGTCEGGQLTSVTPF